MKRRGASTWWWLAGAIALAIALATPQGREVGARAIAAVSGRKSGPRWERLHPELRAKIEQLEQAAAAAGLEVMFWDGWRDPEASAANIAAGTSRLKDPLNSTHVWGLGADVVFKNALGMPSWPADDDPRWRELAELGRGLGLDSGGIMWGWDWPHFQLPGFPVAGLRAQYGTNFLAFVDSFGGAVTA
jgi:hypothetical protein